MLWTYIKYIILLILATFIARCAVGGPAEALYPFLAFLGLPVFLMYTGLAIFLLNRIIGSERPEAYENTEKSIYNGFIEGIVEVFAILIIPFVLPEWCNIQLWALFILLHNIYDVVKAIFMFAKHQSCGE